MNRLRTTAASLRVTITSRPAAFANSPGFPRREFPHFSLDSLSSRQIIEYSDRWIRAKRLSGKEAAEIRTILREKLQQPHLRDLARNPMQLTLLLSLIHAMGPSLPDKRTALYDYYVESFFSREVEKSQTVREHRDLLIAIHRYLAWILHSEAEQGGHRGNISEDRLRPMLEDYLSREGYDRSLGIKLFSGMVERVVSLVSRVEGTYEFEVQPLREYFAARHLYELAPYSPPGREQWGTKPDRFNAMAPNFYWLNVVRFYAGCYSKGELPSLIDCLEQLAEDQNYRFISHPQILTGMLLSDWVFAQERRSLTKATKLALSGLGVRRMVGDHDSLRRQPDNVLKLPTGAGREQLIEDCVQLLKGDHPSDFTRELTLLLDANSTRSERMQMWKREASDLASNQLGRWFAIGLQLGVLGDLSLAELDEILSPGEDEIDPSCWTSLIRGGQFAYVEQVPARAEVVISRVLSGEVRLSWNQRDGSILAGLAQAVDPLRYAERVRHPVGVIPVELGGAANGDESGNERTPDRDALLNQCASFIDRWKVEFTRPGAEWLTGLAPWDGVVEDGRTRLGEQWAFVQLANLASSIRSSRETAAGYDNLHDHSVSLCRRLRYARMRAGSPNWWVKQFGNATTDLERMCVSLSYLSWATTATVMRTILDVQSVFETMDNSSWWRIIRALENQTLSRSIMTAIDYPALEFTMGHLNLSPRVAAAIGHRMKRNDRMSLYQGYLIEYNGTDKPVLDFCQDTAFALAMRDPKHWDHALNVIAKCYSRGTVLAVYSADRYDRARRA